MGKRRITNEEIGKVLFEAITKHSERMAKHEKIMKEVVYVVEHQLSEAKQVSFKPDLQPIESALNQFAQETEKSVKAVQKTLKTPNYLMYSMLIMVVVTFFSVGLSVFSINKLSENSGDKAEIKEFEEMRIYFQTFLNESEEGKKAFEKWKSKRKNH